MTTVQNNPCPCGNADSYENCCKRLHEGQPPKNALQLMRSRYCAYALDIPEYIIQTTHPASPQYEENTSAWKRSISQFSRSSFFKKLEILDFKERESLATVTFTAHLTQKGRDATFSEKSYFEKTRDRWLYRGGQLAEGHAPNLVTTGQLRLIPLAYYGDPILRKKADPVLEITDDIKRLVDEMIETMDACNGLGLAAPQVHHSIRLFIIRTPIETEQDRLELGELKVFINPQITEFGSETWEAQEGCLSIPTIHAQVKRPLQITVEFTDLEGNSHKQQFSGWEAKVILHEKDHLDGVLFIDLLDQEERAKLEPFLQNLEKRIHDGTEL